MKKNKRNYFIIESLKKECTCNGIWIDKKELDDEVGRKMWKMVRQKCLDCQQQKKACLYTILAICGCRSSCFATWSNLDVFLRKKGK